MPIRAVLWDIDDTIFDYTTADRAGMRDHLKAEGLLDGFDSVEQALVVWREITEHHYARFGAGETDFLGQRRDRVRDFLGEAMSDEAADAWFVRYLKHYEAAWALFPDFLPALESLADGYRHAVLSNSSLRNQERKLRTLGVLDRFEAVVCAAELGFSKPAPEAFHAACEVLSLPPHEVLYVGDHPEIDARGATAAGLTGIWLDRSGTGGGIHHETCDETGLLRITGLDQLTGLLRADNRFGAPSTFG